MAIPPWSDRRAKLSGAEFEGVVAELLQALGSEVPGFRLERQELVTAPDGQYRIDITAKFSQLGADFLILAECKDHVRPVEREDVQVLADKMRAVGAQKGIVFSTNGFQRGALEYARHHGIALVRVIEGALTWETRGAPQGVDPRPPAWANIPPFVGHLITLADDHRVRTSLVERNRIEPLARFVASA